ncbi:MAG: hypothetical protein WD972_03495, partial [Candidatus Andersenbacteria bacterium]
GSSTIDNNLRVAQHFNVGTTTPWDGYGVAIATTTIFTSTTSIDGSTFTVNPNENRVGIGTTNPGEKLHIANSGNVDTYTLFENSDGFGRIGMQAATDLFVVNAISGGLGLYAGNAIKAHLGATDTSFYDTSFDTSLFLNGTTGNVGIGITSPTSTLSVMDSLSVWGGTSDVFTVNSSGNATTSGHLVVGTANPNINLSAGDIWGSRATTTNLAVTSLNAGCDVKSDLTGGFYCGTDATGASVGAAWHLLFTNALTPTSSTAGIFVNASSTFNDSLRVNGLLTSTDLRATTLNATSSVIDTLILTNALGVASGGTGASSLTDHGVLIGSGTGAVTPLAVGTNGQLLIGSTGAAPVFATLNCDTNLTCTTGAGTLEIDLDSTITVTSATTTNFAITGISGSTQCLQADTNGTVTGTGSACGSGTAGSPGAWHLLFTNALTPTSSTAGIFVNGSSTIDNNLRVAQHFNVGTTTPFDNYGVAIATTTIFTSTTTVSSSQTNYALIVRGGDGNVGIGTVDPQSRLTVVTPGSATTEDISFLHGRGNVNDIVRLAFYPRGASVQDGIATIEALGTGGPDTQLIFRTSDNGI